MPVGVVDVGSNTVRLLVTEGANTVLSLKETLGLGDAVERHGAIPHAKIVETAAHVARFVGEARTAGAAKVEVLITSPGRQAANGAELLESIATATQAPVRILSAPEEGRLAFLGALGEVRVPASRRIAVVDVGGGSAQIVVGSAREGISWSGTIDVGSRRLTSRVLNGDPPTADELTAARTEVDGLLEPLRVPTIRAAFAVGGSARALKRLVGVRLGADELEDALELVAHSTSAELVERYGLNPARAETLAAGATILAAIQRKLAAPLKVVRAGLREGAIADQVGRRRAA